MDAYTCFEKVRISLTTRSDSVASQIGPSQDGQQSAVTADIMVALTLKVQGDQGCRESIWLRRQQDIACS